MKMVFPHQIKIYIVIFVSGITLSGCSTLQASIPESEQWQVLRVSDGDTLTVRRMSGEEKKLRLCGIDAPEKAQPLGKESKANLQRLVNEVDGTVTILSIESDRYGRTVAEIFSSKNGGEKNFNEEQLSIGLAIIYPQYVSKCPNAIAFGNAERIAKSKKLGLWSGNFQKPWDYRRQQRNR